MKKPTIGMLLIAILLFIPIAGCQSSENPEEHGDTLFQYSLLGSLMAGVFDGELTFSELAQHGDFGLGTFNALDGEMIEIDHQVYQIKSDGAAYPVDAGLKTPFAVVTFFEADQSVNLEGPLDCGQLQERIDSLVHTDNIPYAMKITGTFSRVQTRSVPRQEKPYPTLPEVIAIQPVFELQAVEGVMAGFLLPDYMDVVNAPGYHFHFINADRTAGGHVLDCQVEKATLEIDATGQFQVVLPEDEAFYEVDLSTDEYQ